MDTIMAQWQGAVLLDKGRLARVCEGLLMLLRLIRRLLCAIGDWFCAGEWP